MSWPQVHLALNHIPVLGPFFLGALLGWGWFRKSREIQRTALGGLVLVLLVGVPIKFTGDQAHQALEGTGLLLQEVSQHETWADRATTVLFLTGMLAAVALWKSRAERPLPRWAVPMTLAACLATFLVMAQAAHSGGLLRHPEIAAAPSNS